MLVINIIGYIIITVCFVQNKKITRRKNTMATTSTTGKKAVPEAREALNKFKYEVANEIGVPLKQGYNGDLTSAQNGYVGGYMVKKMIEAQERQMAGR